MYTAFLVNAKYTILTKSRISGKEEIFFYSFDYNRSYWGQEQFIKIPYQYTILNMDVELYFYEYAWGGKRQTVKYSNIFDPGFSTPLYTNLNLGQSPQVTMRLERYIIGTKDYAVYVKMPLGWW